jgi:hypothetical protein
MTTSWLSRTAALAYAQQNVHAELAHLLLAEDLDLKAERLQRLDATRVLFRVEDVGGSATRSRAK